VLLNYFVDLGFVIDIIVNFNSAYEDKDQILVSNRKKIATTYVKSWFIIDCIAVVPFDVLLDSTVFGDAFKGMRAAKLYKLMKLTRLMRILKVIKDKNKLQKAVTQSLGVGVAFERLSFFILIFVIL
jgi:hypothetical protein